MIAMLSGTNMQLLSIGFKWSFYLVYTLALLLGGSVVGLWLMIEVFTFIVHMYG